jgi:hypothetical protein
VAKERTRKASSPFYRFGFLIVAMVVIGGEGGSKILWMYLFPLIVFFLLGKIEGLL